jgi:hypothetical protein
MPKITMSKSMFNRIKGNEFDNTIWYSWADSLPLFNLFIASKAKNLPYENLSCSISHYMLSVQKNWLLD